MDKKRLTILLAIFIVSVFFTKAFGQAEKEVMKRYDYSSPRASYESLKKAIMGKDFEGVYIHTWQTGRALSLEEFQVSFEEALQNVKNQTAHVSTDVIESLEVWYSISGGWIKLSETDFLKESERERAEEGDTKSPFCFITAQRQSDRKQIELEAINIDGTSEWWIYVYPGQ